jgi:Arc/MetJ family transcription regulator
MQRFDSALRLVLHAHGGGARLNALHDLHACARLMQMRTTLNLDDELLQRALRLSGLKEKTAVLHAGLEALIQRESARQLAALGGTERKLKQAPRRRAKRG